MGRHLALRVLFGRAQNGDNAEIAAARMDRRGDFVVTPAVSRRARDGLDGRRHRGVVLIHTPLTTTSVLDEATDVVSMSAPWAGLLIATALPYRFLQALFLDQLLEVGSAASHYGNLLGTTANVTVATILLAFWGRAVYARACRLALGHRGAPGGEALRVRPVALASYVLTGATALLIGYVSLFTIVGFIVAVIFSGIAVGTMELNERVSVAEPFRKIFHFTKRVGIPIALSLVFLCALFVALFNLVVAFQLGQWLAGAVGGFDAPNWQVLFSGANRRFVLILFAGAIVLIEPFWIAAQVVFVRKAGAEESGDDLRRWFEELTT
jgi:hypothetical protein